MVNISSERFIFLIWVYAILISISNANASLAASSSFVDFDQCLARHFPPHLVFYRNSSSYTKLLNSSIQNDRFSIDGRSPLLILTPKKASQVQASIRCSKRYDFHIRVLSGGHDYEGLSFLSLNEPFVSLHLLHLRSVSVDVAGSTAWVESGATVGELYYGIALMKSKTHGFPAGLCPTVGVGGHVSGGGIGAMVRKYGLASDNVVDAKLVDVRGRVLDRSSMGEDLFWAIRGGGAASFGVVLAWKVKLVPVPPTVTVFTVRRTLRENVTELVRKWQHIGLEGIWKRIEKEDMVYIILDPFGGRMSKISKTETAFPHRRGTLYNIQYIVNGWTTGRLRSIWIG